MKTPSSVRALIVGTLFLIPLHTLQAAERLSLIVDLPPQIPVFSVVSAELHIRNAGDQPVTLANASELSDLRVEMRTASGELVYRGATTLPERITKETLRRPTTLAPGQSSSFRAPLACRWTADGKLIGPFFGSPGNYTLVFHFPVQRQQGGNVTQTTLVSGPVQVQVVDVAPNEVQAYTRIRQLPIPAIILDPDATLRALNSTDQTALVPQIRSFIDAWPASRWTPLAKFTLAHILRNVSVAPGGASDGAIAEANAYIQSLADAPNFPYTAQVRKLAAYFTKTLRNKSAASSANGKVLIQTKLSAEAINNITRGLQRLAEALHSGRQEELAPLLADDFLMNERLDRANSLAGLTADRSRLGGTLPTVTAELLSAEPSGAEYLVHARLRSERLGRTDTQEVRLVGAFTGGQVRLRRWNRVAATESNQRK